MDVDLDETGPIDFLIVEFPGDRLPEDAFPILLDLVGRGVIRILDLAFVSKGLDGAILGLTLDDVDGDGQLARATFEGGSHRLRRSDLDEAGAVLRPGHSAGVFAYENVWAVPFATALRRAGGQLVASGRIPVQAVLSAAEAVDPVS